MASKGTINVPSPSQQFDLQRQLLFAAWNQQLQRARHLLATHPELDLSHYDPEDPEQNSALHLSADFGFVELVQLLTEQPQIDVNLKNSSGATPFLLACTCGRGAVVRHLVTDPRVEVNTPDSGDATPLWWAGYYNYTDIVRILVASGRPLELELPGRTAKAAEKHTIFEVVSHITRANVEQLLLRFVGDSMRVRHALRRQLGMMNLATAELFALIVMVCDDYAEVIVPRQDEALTRFLAVATRLPMDLQMLLCNRVYQLPASVIHKRDCELAFRNVFAWDF